MGNWARYTFGTEKYSSVGFMLVGHMLKKTEQQTLSLFDEVVSSKEKAYHAHLVKQNNKFYPIITNVYGGPAALEITALLHDGGCRNLIFIGFAYGGFKDFDVGSIVLSTEAYHFDGLYTKIDPTREKGLADKELMQKVKTVFNKNNLNYFEGPNISVPAVTLQPSVVNNKEFEKISPITLEMELAACYSRSNDLGIRPIGILTIGDNKKVPIGSKECNLARESARHGVLKLLLNNLDEFDLPSLDVKEEFNVEKYMLGIYGSG